MITQKALPTLRPTGKTNGSKRRGWVRVCTDLKSAVTTWRAINTKDLVAFNAVLTRNNLPPIAAATPALSMPVCAAALAPAGGHQ